MNATGVGGEAAKVFAGSNPALADRSEWSRILTPSTPLHTIRAKIAQATEMGEQALAANVANYNEGMRTNHDPREFLTPRSQQIIDAIKQGKPISSLGGSSTATQTTAAIPPGSVSGTKGGVRGYQRRGAWPNGGMVGRGYRSGAGVGHAAIRVVLGASAGRGSALGL